MMSPTRSLAAQGCMAGSIVCSLSTPVCTVTVMCGAVFCSSSRNLPAVSASRWPVANGVTTRIVRGAGGTSGCVAQPDVNAMARNDRERTEVEDFMRGILLCDFWAVRGRTASQNHTSCMSLQYFGLYILASDH